jgi:hypothetical protein
MELMHLLPSNYVHGMVAQEQAINATDIMRVEFNSRFGGASLQIIREKALNRRQPKYCYLYIFKLNAHFLRAFCKSYFDVYLQIRSIFWVNRAQG